MRYKSEEYREPQPPKPGTYEFIVTEAVEKISQQGNDYIKLTLSLLNTENQIPIKVYHNLINTDAMLWTTKHFCEAMDIDFSSNQLSASECIGKRTKGYFDWGKPKSDGTKYLELKTYEVVQARKAAKAAQKLLSPDSPTLSDNKPEEDGLPF